MDRGMIAVSRFKPSNHRSLSKLFALAVVTLLWPLTLGAGEGKLPDLGSPPEALFDARGKPSSVMDAGSFRVLVYDEFRVKVVDDKIVAYEPIRDYATKTKAASTQASGGAQGGPELVGEIRNQGQRQDIAALLVKGKVTVVDFFADWCGPCKQLDPKLRQMVRNEDGVYLRKVDIVDWKSPIVQQIGIKFVPYVAVFDGSGRLVGTPSADMSEIRANVAKAKAAARI